MKKSTLFLVAAALTLGIVAILVTRGGDKPAPKKLDIAGYATVEELERDKKRGMLDPVEPIAHPIDEIILEREDGKLRMVREGEGEKAVWRLVEPVDAVAVKWHADSIAEVFKSPTTRSDTRALKPEDFPLFDFEAGRRIGLTLKSKGATWNGVDLIIGQVVKDDGPEGGVKGTWVMVKGDEATAYLLAGKDLRTPANKTLSELRDKKVFAFEGDDISKIEITPDVGTKVVLTSTTTEEPAPEAAPGTPPTKKTTWALTEPAGLAGDPSVSSLARSLGSLRADDFFSLDKADDAAKKALEGPTWRYALTVGDKTQVLIVADGDKDRAWARIDGRDELMALSGWTAKNLKKGLEDLKDKTVWELGADQITGLTLTAENGGALSLTRGPSGWAFVTPTLPYPADPSSILSGVAKLSAVRWARPDEVAAARQALTTPEITATVQAGTTRIVVVSAKLDGDDAQNRWAVVGDVATAEPFLVSDFTAKRFVSTPAALRSKKVFADIKDQIAAITVTLTGSTDTVRLEKTDTGFNLLGMLPGEAMNDEAVRALVAALFGLEVKTFHEGKAVADTGLSADKSHVIGLELSDGRRVSLLVSQVSSGDAEVYGLASDGPQKDVPVGLNEYQVKNITKARAELVKTP